MRDLRRVSYARLVEVVGEREGVSPDALAAAQSDAERGGILLPEAIIKVGAASEWELMRLVALEFGLPILHMGAHDLDRDLVRSFPPELVARSLALPVDRFKQVLTVAMPVFSPADVLEEFGARVDCEVYPVVGSLEENRRIVEITLRIRRESADEASWEKIFDEANAAVLRETGRNG